MNYLVALIIPGILAAVLPVLMLFAGHFLSDMLDILRGVDD